MSYAETFTNVGKRVCPLSTRDLVDRILVFIDALGAMKLYTYQSLFCQRIVESVLIKDGATITGLWARQCGKTESCADVALGLCVLLPELAKSFPDDVRLKPYVNGFRVGIYAPIQEQSDIAFGRMREKVSSRSGVEILNDEEINVHLVGNRADSLTFSNGSYIFSRTASPDSKIEGKTYDLVLLEEAQKLLATKVEKEIRPMTTATFGSIVMIGTAWESRGGFHRDIQRNLDLYELNGVRNHFEFPYDIVIAEKRRAFEKDGNPSHLMYERTMETLYTRLGGKAEAERSPEFQMNYMCLWRESRAIAIRPEVFKAARVLDLEAGPRRGLVQVAGLDIGKVVDATVLTIGEVDMAAPVRNPHALLEADPDKQIYYPKTIVDWLEMAGAFEGFTGQYARLVQYLAFFNVQILVIDATSINGDAVFERIEAMVGDSIICVPYKFSSMSKSLLYKYYLQELHSGRLKYAAGPETQQTGEYQKFVAEHENLDRVEVGGYAVCQAPDGEHDDFCDSAALMCWGERLLDKLTMPEVQVTSASNDGGESRWNPGKQPNMSGQGGMADLTSTGGNARGGRYSRRW